MSHSAASDMTTIEQEDAPAPRALDDLDDFNNVFVMIRYRQLIIFKYTIHYQAHKL